MQRRTEYGHTTMDESGMDEVVRLAALESYNILDTPPETEFDDLTQIAATICDTPIALVAFIDKERQWFKAALGLGELKETPRALSFCKYTLETKDTLVIPNAAADPVFRSHPFVLDEPNVRFYAGAPILDKTGNVLGTVCVVDTVARSLSYSQVHALESLARLASVLLAHRAPESAEAALTNF